MKLGVLMPHRLDAADVVGFARRVEGLGFDELWIPENTSYVGGVAAVGIALASTESIRIGLGVMPVSLRHPFVVAMEVGTLAGAFPGRFVAGFGSGVSAWLDALDSQPKSPLSAVRETVSAVDALLRGDTVEINGGQFGIHGQALAASVQTRPPLMIAALGPRMLALAGKRTQGAILSVLSSPEFVSIARSELDAATTNDDTTRELITFTNVYVGETTGAAIGALRADTEFILEAMGPGRLTESIDISRTEYDSWADSRGSAPTVPDEWVRRMSVAGTFEECQRRVELYAAAGTSTLVLSPKPADRAVELLEKAALLR